MIALLPGFMSSDRAITYQLVTFLAVILPSEFLSMSLYASGGSGLRRFLSSPEQLSRLNRIAAILMVLVAALMFSKL